MYNFDCSRFTRRLFDILIAVCLVSAVISSTQPLISVKVGYDTVLVRGFNLMEFSALGCVPVLAPVILLFIIFSAHDTKTKEMSIMAVLIITAVCYCNGFIAAREWLMGITEGRIAYHPCSLLFPVFILLEGFSWLAKALYLRRNGTITSITFHVPWNWIGN